jgi:hypothetical protein
MSRRNAADVHEGGTCKRAHGVHELDVGSLPQLRRGSRCAKKDERGAKASERA